MGCGNQFGNIEIGKKIDFEFWRCLCFYWMCIGIVYGLPRLQQLQLLNSLDASCMTFFWSENSAKLWFALPKRRQIRLPPPQELVQTAAKAVSSCSSCANLCPEPRHWLCPVARRFRKDDFLPLETVGSMFLFTKKWKTCRVCVLSCLEWQVHVTHVCQHWGSATKRT